MQIKPDEITSILKSRIEGLDSDTAELTEVGTVLSVADGICRIHGLENCMSFEMLELPHDVTGLALNLESDNVGAVLFGEWENIVEGDTVKRTKRLLEIKGTRSVDSFHRELGKIMWDYCGMSRTAEGLKTALSKIPALREQFRLGVDANHHAAASQSADFQKGSSIELF